MLIEFSELELQELRNDIEAAHSEGIGGAVLSPEERLDLYKKLKFPEDHWVIDTVKRGITKKGAAP